MTASSIDRFFTPTTADGGRVPPEPHFDDWDDTPHAHYTVDVTDVELGDVVLGGTHQVAGCARAEQRGNPAIRLDLEYLVGSAPSGLSSGKARDWATARAVLPVGHRLLVKRYDPDTPYKWAWVHLTSEDGDYRPGLVPDYGSNVERCGCRTDHDENEDGFDAGETMCDRCVESWGHDHTVIRHNR